MNYRTAHVILLSALSLCFVCNCESQTTKPCRSATVQYTAPWPEFDKRIKILKPAQAESLAPSAKKVSSPQGTRWFVQIDPDYSSVAKPWSTTLRVGSNAGDKLMVDAIFSDHDNTFSAYWINEKLLFVQVWWGRIASSDLILNVDTGKFVYNEMASYGELGEPCH